MLNNNERAPNELKLVTDGKTLYKIHPKHKMPGGLTELLQFRGRKIYDSKGKMLIQFKNVREIEPSINPTYLSRSIRHGIANGN